MLPKVVKIVKPGPMDSKITQSYAILKFYRQLDAGFRLPRGVNMMNPFTNKETWKLVESFYGKFYNDYHSRTLLFGINPGRWGGGITGIPFTDPIRLKEDCGISHSFASKPELSSIFIYQMIAEFGGVKEFYSKFHITALSPLGFTRNDKNLNYYDDKALLEASMGFIIDCIRKQLSFPAVNREFCYCIGEGKNLTIFNRLNSQYNFFEKIIPLPHPRFIMQYRRKRVQEFIRQYLDVLAMAG